MSRHGYQDDLDDLAMGRWIGCVRNAIRGKRGQGFLREMLAALDAMPEKRLIREELVTEQGEVCAMGAVLKRRGVDVSGVDPECPDDVATAAGIAQAMVREIAYENDEEYGRNETPEQRWTRMRAWAVRQIRESRDE